MKIEELTPDHKALLLQQPHQLFVVDAILALNVGAFTTSLTLSNNTPNGIPAAVGTFNASTKDLYDIAKAIVTEIESKKPEIENAHKAFLK